jgi:hypothetical protein
MLTRPLSDALAEAEEIITSAPHVRTQADLDEGQEYLAGCVQAALRMAWAYQPGSPRFVTSTGPYMKYGLDNPDTLYLHAYLRPGVGYLLTGRRGTTVDLNFQILNGDYTPVEVPDSLTAFDDRELEISADGRFSFAFQAPEGASMLVVRECYSDWAGERRGTIAIRRADGESVVAAPDPAKRYRVAAKMLISQLRTFLAFPEWFYLKEPVNTLTAPRRTPGGLATQFSSVGHYELADDEAMIVTVPRADVPYQGIQLGSMWYTSLDYIDHQTSLTADQARTDPDGMLRFVISERDPGVTNWLERTGHDRGYIQLRWQRLPRGVPGGRPPGPAESHELTAADGPSAEVVPLDALPGKLPFYEDSRISPGEYAARVAGRRAAVAERMVF